MAETTVQLPTLPSPTTDGPGGEVLTLAEAAAYLRLREQDVIAAVLSQGLPSRLVNGEWRFLLEAIREWLGTAQPSDEARRAAMLAAAGTWVDDPDLEEMVEEIYRQRGRPITEDGSYRLFHGLDRADFPSQTYFAQGSPGHCSAGVDGKEIVAGAAQP